MITNQEIVDTYLKYRGKRRTSTGKIDNTLPLMPFFIMDVVYQIYNKDIKNIECKHQMKRYRTQWVDNYNKFNHEFFRAFNNEQRDYIIDLMDEFAEYIHNTIVMMKSAVVNSFTQETEFEDKRNLAALLTCNVLCQTAQHLYGDMYRTWSSLNNYNVGEQHTTYKYACVDMHGMRYMKKETNQHITGVQQATYKLACWYPAGKEVDLTASDKVMDMINVLCKKIVYFLKLKDETVS